MSYTTKLAGTTANNLITAIEMDGQARLEIKVDGFWSTSITLYIDRNNYKGEWRYTWSHSSGGRDNDSEVTDVEAMRNFADAMGFGARYLESAKDMEHQLNEAYAKYYANMKAEFEEQERIRKERREQERAAREARIAPLEEFILDKAKATEIAETAYKTLKSNDKFFRTFTAEAVDPDLFARGKVEYYSYTCNTYVRRNYDGKIHYYWNDRRMSKSRWIENMTGNVLTYVSAPQIAN